MAETEEAKIVPKDTHPTADAVSVRVEDAAGLIATLQGQAEAVRTSRGTWEERFDRFYRKRYGVRPARNFPWPNAANLHIPIVDKHIRKMKPAYLNLIWSQRPIANFVPDDPDPVAFDMALRNEETVEWTFDHLLRSNMDFFLSSSLLTDRCLERGIAVAKIVWDYRETRPRVQKAVADLPPDLMEVLGDLDEPTLAARLCGVFGLDYDDGDDRKSATKAARQIQAGDPTFSIRVPRIDYNAPRVLSVDPMYVTFPYDTPLDLNEAEWIRDESIRLTPQQLKEAARDGRFDPEVVAEVLAKSGYTDPVGIDAVNSTEARREGQSPQEHARVEVHEYYFYHDVDGDGVGERCMMTVAKCYPEAPLRGPIELPYQHGKWPFVLVPFEMNENRAVAPRGVAELLDGLQTEITEQHNAGLDNMTLATAPMITYIPGTISPANARFVPGQWVPVAELNSVQMVEYPDKKFSHDQEERILKSYGEEYVGSVDYGLMNENSQANAPRTKYEIQSIQSQSATVFGLSAMVYNWAMAHIFEQVWSLWLQYGPEDFLMPDATSKGSGQLVVIKIPKAALQGRYKIIPQGKAGFRDPVLEAQKAMAMLEVFKNDPLIDQRELRRWYLATQDPIALRRLLKTPEVIAQEQQAAMLQAQMQGEEKQSTEGYNARSGAARQLAGPLAPAASATQTMMAGGAA